MEVNQEEAAVSEGGMFPWRLVMLIVLAAVLVTIVVASAAVYMWREVANQRIVEELQRRLELAVIAQEESAGVKDLETASTASAQPVKEGWQTYVHSRYNYQIDYPAGAVITESKAGVHSASLAVSANGESVVEENVPYLDGLCVTIKNEFGSVSISAPGNRYVTCGPTGVGSEAEQQSKEVMINGSLLRASGYRGSSQAGQLPDYGWFEFTTDNGFKVVYTVNLEAGDDALRFDEVKDAIEGMVATFRSID